MVSVEGVLPPVAPAQALPWLPSLLRRVPDARDGTTIMARSEMALRLSKALGRTPESWLAMQNNYDLWQVRQSVDLIR